MSTGEALLRTIGSIYSVPGNTRAWSDAIGSISELVGARASAYLMVDAADGSVEAAEHSGFPQEVVDAYLALGGAARDVRFKYSEKLVPARSFVILNMCRIGRNTTRPNGFSTNLRPLVLTGACPRKSVPTARGMTTSR